MMPKEQIVKLGHRLGFEIVKMCSAEPFTDYERTLKERIKAGLYPKDLIDYEGILKNVSTYTDPSSSLPNAKTIISVAFCYCTRAPTDLTKSGDPHGVIARAYQRDVYGETYRRRARFAELLRKRGIKVAEKTLIPQKMAAVRAGVGWQGKNSLIQTEKHGSWITLDSLVTDADFEHDEPLRKDCGSCQACQHACPTSAIQAPGTVNVNKCIDYLTVKTGPIPRDLRTKMGNKLVSCDRCQEVCPNNRNVKPVAKKIPPHDPDYGSSPSLLSLLNISRRRFEKLSKNWDFIDPKPEYFQRNIAVALGNLRDPAAMPALRKLLGERKQIVREHAAWALGVIHNGQAYEALKQTQ